MDNKVWVLTVVNGGNMLRPMVFVSEEEARGHFAGQCRQYGFERPLIENDTADNITVVKDGVAISLQHCGVIDIEESRMEMVFCNLGEPDAPENPKQFLEDFKDSFWDDEDPRHPGKMLDVLSIFEWVDADDLLSFIESGKLA